MKQGLQLIHCPITAQTRHSVNISGSPLGNLLRVKYFLSRSSHSSHCGEWPFVPWFLLSESKLIRYTQDFSP